MRTCKNQDFEIHMPTYKKPCMQNQNISNPHARSRKALHAKNRFPVFTCLPSESHACENQESGKIMPTKAKITS